MTSPAQPGIGDANKLHHVMGHDPWSYPNFKRGYAQIKRDYSVNGGWKGTSTHSPKKNILRTKNK